MNNHKNKIAISIIPPIEGGNTNMSEKEKNAIRRIAVTLYREGKISFEEQMNVLAILQEKNDCLGEQELAAAAG